MYSAVTDGVKVTVVPAFLPDQSDPAHERYLWSYEIEIANLGASVVQLVARRWIITDALGRREEVSGAGVVGEQPILRPGEAFRYMSGCPLATPSGMMVGTYRLIDDAGRAFDVAIPAFALESPFARKVLN